MRSKYTPRLAGHELNDAELLSSQRDEFAPTFYFASVNIDGQVTDLKDACNFLCLGGATVVPAEDGVDLGNDDVRLGVQLEASVRASVQGEADAVWG